MRITLAHGGGGIDTVEILEKLILSKVPEKLKKVSGGVGIDLLDDGAAIPLGDGRYLVVSMDSYTVNPIKFPGGNIGKLAAVGSINDVVVKGAKPVAMMDSFVVEEGMEGEELEEIVNSFIEVLKGEGVALVGGDFKVMPRGAIDKVVISTVCFGVAERLLLHNAARPGDKVVVTGTVGDHGAVIMALQHGLDIDIESDCAPLTKVMRLAMDVCGDALHTAKDITRGGLAMALYEISKNSNVDIVVYEESVPIHPTVAAYCDMLGADPLHLASEGKAVLIVSSDVAEKLVEELRNAGYEQAAVIGEVVNPLSKVPRVYLKTKAGGTRILEPPRGEIVPRIC